MRVDRLVEIAQLPFEKNWLFANIDDEVIVANSVLARRTLHRAEHGTDDPATHHSFIVRTDRWTALVDTCCGNHKPRPRVPVWDQLNQPYLENMRALGVHPEEIDFVMCTHLHVDHVGWNRFFINKRLRSRPSPMHGT